MIGVRNRAIQKDTRTRNLAAIQKEVLVVVRGLFPKGKKEKTVKVKKFNRPRKKEKNPPSELKKNLGKKPGIKEARLPIQKKRLMQKEKKTALNVKKGKEKKGSRRL